MLYTHRIEGVYGLCLRFLAQHEVDPCTDVIEVYLRPSLACRVSRPWVFDDDVPAARVVRVWWSFLLWHSGGNIATNNFKIRMRSGHDVRWSSLGRWKGRHDFGVEVYAGDRGEKVQCE